LIPNLSALGPLLVVAAMSGGLCGCGASARFRNVDALEEFVYGAHSPFVITNKIGDLEFSLRYLPTDALLIDRYREYMREAERLVAHPVGDISSRSAALHRMRQDLAAQRAGYENSLYFKLSISNMEDSSRHREMFGTWLQQLMFRMQERISLQTAQISEIPLETYHMVRTFGLLRDTSFLLVFSRYWHDRVCVSGSEQRWMKLRIREFGLKTGTITFEYRLPFKQVVFDIQAGGLTTRR
jgi:hypothetical protein